MRLKENRDILWRENVKIQIKEELEAAKKTGSSKTPL